MEVTNFFYNEPRLAMTVAGRFLVRIVSYFSYSFLLASAAVLALSEIPSLRAGGLLLILFFADRVLHFGMGDLALNKITLKNSNIANYVSPETYRVIEIAFDRALVTKTDITINILSELLRKAEVERAIAHLGINFEEFKSKIEHSSSRTLEHRQPKEEVMKHIDTSMLSAFEQARLYQEPAITPVYLFAALEVLEHQKLAELFAMFGSSKDDLRYAAVLSRLYRPKQNLQFDEPLLKTIEIARAIEHARNVRITLSAVKLAAAATDPNELLERVIQRAESKKEITAEDVVQFK